MCTHKKIESTMNSMGLNSQGDKRKFKKFDCSVTTISIGQIHICTGNEGIGTVVGSCICCCIWDPKLCIGGMNHFVLADDNTNDASTINLYGQWCMESLLNCLYKLGSQKKDLKAKVFGGGNILSNNQLKPGFNNIKFIKSYLNNEDIEILSENIGGNCSRKIYFFPSTGAVKLKQTTYKPRLQRITKIESHYRQTHQTVKPGNIEIF